jgi:hypothetical protein
MAEVRGKFYVAKVTNHSATSTYVEVELNAVYSNGKPEDNSYSAATPSGKIAMTITNPDAVAKLPIGGKFYVDFTRCEEG